MDPRASSRKKERRERERVARVKHRDEGGGGIRDETQISANPTFFLHFLLLISKGGNPDETFATEIWPGWLQEEGQICGDKR